MADRLTQLQDCLDDLLTQMYASLNYIQTRHPYGEIEGQPSQAPAVDTPATPNDASARTNGETQTETQQSQLLQQNAPTSLPDRPNVFNAALRELAQDLILKEQQIEHLINSLPGLDKSEEDQERRMRRLQVELKAVEAQRARKEAERESMVQLLGEVVGKVRRVQ